MAEPYGVHCNHKVVGGAVDLGSSSFRRKYYTILCHTMLYEVSVMLRFTTKHFEVRHEVRYAQTYFFIIRHNFFLIQLFIQPSRFHRK